MTDFQKTVKRLMDIFLSLGALAVFSPVMLIIAVLIKLESKGPLFFIQERVGKDKKLFNVYKFRSMTVDTVTKNDYQEITKADHRVTRVGKIIRQFGLDELPQVFNILKGEMSIVGPRPTLGYQVEEYTDEQSRRLEVKPGVTGLAQIHGRTDIPWEKRIKYDIEYIDNYSLWLDVSIILKTVPLLFGIYEQDKEDKK